VHKLMLLFKKTDDPLELERLWSERFVKRAERMPGLRRVAVSRVVGGPEPGDDLHLIHEFYFDDMAALQEAMGSPEGQEAGKALMSFAAGAVKVYFAEHLEEPRGG